MDEKIRLALEADLLVDITTTGRKTGQPHRIEISLHFIDGRIFLSGRPDSKKDWFANLCANPQLTFHFKQSLSLDVPATAKLVREEKLRRKVLSAVITEQPEPQDLAVWVRHARLVEIVLKPQDE